VTKRQSLFGRLLITYLGILLVSVIIILIVLSRLINTYFYAQREQVLLQRAQQVNQLVQEVDRGALARAELRRMLSIIERNEQLTIFIVDRNGHPTPDPRTLPNLPLQSFVERVLPRILEGEQVRSIRDVPNREGIRHLTVGVPLTLRNDVAGAVFVATPVHVVLTTRRPVFRLVWLTVGGVTLLAAFIIYLVSRRIADPLEEVSRGALALSRGDFSYRVPVDSDDEVGLVARSFNHMAAQLEQLERMRREFVANVSHELRTPLTSIRGFLQGIIDGAVPQEEQHRYLDLALSELERLNRLANDLLDLASLESGRFQLQLGQHDAFELARRALIKLEPLMMNKRLEVNADLPEQSGMARLDPDRFEQVLVNLLSNAAQFTPEGGSIRLEGRVASDELSVAITDTGPGIAPEQLPHIWDRFYRGDRSRTVRGTGLGLTIARYLVEAHRGRIKVDSTPGKGSTFTITLPRLTDSFQ